MNVKWNDEWNYISHSYIIYCLYVLWVSPSVKIWPVFIFTYFLVLSFSLKIKYFQFKLITLLRNVVVFNYFFRLSKWPTRGQCKLTILYKPLKSNNSFQHHFPNILCVRNIEKISNGKKIDVIDWILALTNWHHYYPITILRHHLVRSKFYKKPSC